MDAIDFSIVIEIMSILWLGGNFVLANSFNYVALHRYKEIYS